MFFKGDDRRGTEKELTFEREFAAIGVEVVYFPCTIQVPSRRLCRALEVASESTEVRRV